VMDSCPLYQGMMGNLEATWTRLGQRLESRRFASPQDLDPEIACFDLVRNGSRAHNAGQRHLIKKLAVADRKSDCGLLGHAPTHLESTGPDRWARESGGLSREEGPSAVANWVFEDPESHFRSPICSDDSVSLFSF